MEKSGLLQYTTPGNALKAMFVGIIGLALTFGSAYFVKNGVERASIKEFQSICLDIAGRIDVRMAAQAQLLRCGAAFFAGSDSVEREDWKIFYEKSNIDHNLPGISGFGYTMIIPEGGLAAHIVKVRKEGFPDYTVRPSGQREVYTSILYLEPFEGRNLRAFGYDMFSEPVRRRAMETARDSNVATVTGKVVLVQETETDTQPGTLMYVPVYRNGMPVGTVTERRAAILGWVYSPYRMNDLMQGILGRWEETFSGRVHLQIFDDDQLSENALLYDSQGTGRVMTGAGTYSLPVDLNGKRWTLLFSRSQPENLLVESKVFLVIISGLIISFLLYGLALSRFNIQYRARLIAGRLTSEIETASERLSLAVRASKVGIWDWNVVSNELIWDDQMYALYGITASRFKGAYQSWLDGLHPEDRDRGNQEIQACLRGEKDFDTEFRVCWPDGSVHILRAMATVQRDEQGNPLNVIGTNWDITEQKQREDDLLNAKMAADYASQSKSEFLSRMSHELRTPLNAILGFAQLLDIGALTTSQKRAVHQILVSGKSLLEMINNVLDISSMDTGRLDISPEPVSITDILPGILDDLKPRAFEKRVKIDLSESLTDSGLVTADRIRFRQVMYNLLSNALKFNREGGKVTILSEKIIRDGKCEYVRFSVTDTGNGIRQENLKHLFQPFERVEPDQIDYSGRGLGLALVKKVVLAMNGTYGVESVYGEGSTFWIELPCAS